MVGSQTGNLIIRATFQISQLTLRIVCETALGDAITFSDFVPWEQILSAYPSLNEVLRRKWSGVSVIPGNADFARQVNIVPARNQIDNHQLVFFALQATDSPASAPLGRCWKVRALKPDNFENDRHIMVDFQPLKTYGSFGSPCLRYLKMWISDRLVSRDGSIDGRQLEFSVRDHMVFREYFDELISAGEERGQDECTLFIGISRLVAKAYHSERQSAG